MKGSARTDKSGLMLNRISTHSDRFLRLIVTLLVLTFPAATLYINHGDSYTLGLLGLIGVWVWLRDGARVWLKRDSGILWLSFVLFFAIVVLSYVTGYQTEDGFHYLGRYLRFLFVVPTYLVFRRYSPTVRTVFTGLAFGALVAGVLASLEFMHTHAPIRVDAQTDVSIIYGDLASTLVLCTIAGFGLMAASRRSWSVPLLILSLAGGVVATLLSGTRGAWLPLLLLIPALATPAAGYLKHRYIFAIALVLITVFSSFYFMTSTGTQSRFISINQDLRNYIVARDTLDSLQKQPHTLMHCLDNEVFLRAWMGAGYPAGGVSPEVALVVDTGLNEITDVGVACSSVYVLRIHNPDLKKAAQYVFPRATLDPDGTQHTRLLVRGTGVITFAGSHDSGASINTPKKYVNISLASQKAPGSALNVFIGPSGTLWLAPIESYLGEYSFSIGNTSIGQRLELWRAAWQLFLQRPWFGNGTGAFQAKLQYLIQDGLIVPFVGIYDHPHNDYLNALACRGILGFAALLAILLIPAWRFLRWARSPDREAHAVAMAGMLTVAGFAIFALTDTIFLHSMMITWYVLYMALFYSLLDTLPEPLEFQKPVL